MIVLYNPRSTFSPHIPFPMALLAVGSMLEGEIDYHLVDGNREIDPVERILALARQRRPDAIGLSVMPGPQLTRAVKHSRQLRAELPGVPLIWGGYFPSQHAETILQDGAIDYCVRGQGEETFRELIRTLRHGGDLSAIAGLSYRQDNAIFHTANRKLVALDELPDWPYDRLPMDGYFHKHYLGNRVGTHQTSYGCPFGCSFCAIVSIANRSWVAQSPERVAAVLSLQKERWGADAMQFHDMDFFIKEARVVEISERIAPLGMTWWALGRVDELMRYKDTTWQKMKASGLKMVFCGAEAGSEEVLERMNKGGKVSPNATLELARRMRDYDVVPEFSFVLGNPPDPMSDIDDTLRFIRRVKEANPATEIVLYMYTPVPLDGALFAEAQDLGFRFPQTLDEWAQDDWREFSIRRDPHNPWLNPALMRKVRNFERVLNATFPTTTDLSLRGLKRALLRGAGGWRYRTGVYGFPVELRVLQRAFRYQRPETAGF